MHHLLRSSWRSPFHLRFWVWGMGFGVTGIFGGVLGSEIGLFPFSAASRALVERDRAVWEGGKGGEGRAG
jgi:hypothetical protein